MTLKSQIADDLAATVFNTGEFATEITYTPRNGTDATVQAALAGDVDTYEETESAEYARRSMEITVPRAADIGVADPHKDDTVTINGEVWSVVSIVRQDDDASILAIERVQIGERHGENFYSGEARG